MFHAADPLLGTLLFWAFALIAILCSVGLLIARHPLSGAINLIGVMLSLSGLYALMNSPFLAVLQVLVYAGAIMVLVVFVIMVLNQAKDHKVPYLDWRALIALPLPVLLCVALVQTLNSGRPAAEASATIEAEDPQHLIEAPLGHSQALTVTMRARDLGPDQLYKWDFGDKQSEFGREVTHRYNEPGSYEVHLAVSVATATPPASKSPGRPAAAASPDHSAVQHLRIVNVVRADVATVAATMFDTTTSGPGYYLLFEIIGVLLLTAVVAAVVLAKRSLATTPDEGDVSTQNDKAEGHH